MNAPAGLGGPEWPKKRVLKGGGIFPDKMGEISWLTCLERLENEAFMVN